MAALTRTEIQRKYDQKNTRFFGLKLNIKTDNDIIGKLETVETIQGYIKQLIRDDIKRNQQEQKTD